MSVPCRSCQKPVTWATTEKGKSMPVDAEPVAFGGNIVLRWDHTKPLAPPVAHVLTKKERAERRDAGQIGGLYRSHFVTCPAANGWRR